MAKWCWPFTKFCKHTRECNWYWNHKRYCEEWNKPSVFRDVGKSVDIFRNSSSSQKRKSSSHRRRSSSHRRRSSSSGGTRRNLLK